MRKLMSNVLVLSLVFSFIAVDLWGQNFTNNGGTYNTGSGAAVLRMKASGGLFNGSTPIGAVTAIPGTVNWGASCTVPMAITPLGAASTYYTNLTTSGTGAKTYTGNVFVAGTYVPQGGDRTYTGMSFNYNGTGATPQAIAGEYNGGNGTGYSTLVLSGGAPKTLATGLTATVSAVYTQTGSAFTNDGTITLGTTATSDSSITNNATGIFNGGTGSFTISGANASIYNAGTFTLNAAAGATFTTASLIGNTGGFNLGGGIATTTGNIVNETGGIWNFGAGTFSNTQTFTNNTNGVGGAGVFLGATDGAATFNNFANLLGAFDAAGGSTINLSGNFTAPNVAGNGPITFACTQNFNYTGASQNILKNTVATPAFTQYGNLSITGTGTATATGDVSVCNILAVNQSGGVPANGKALDMATNNGVLTMLNATGVASYLDSTFETFGKFRWNSPGTTEHVYNNMQTKVAFDVAPTNGTNNNYFQLDITPATTPSQASDIVAADVIKRKIVASYDNSAAIPDGVISSLKVGWKASDETGYTVANYNYLIFTEGIAIGTPMQRLIRSGNAFLRNTGTYPHTIDYAGGAGPGISLINGAGGGTTRQISTGSEIILSSAPMDVISVKNGRWSDPNTWDIGQVPFANDNVHVRNIVWTGIDIAGSGQSLGAMFGVNTIDANETDGSQPNDNGAAANKIYIDNGTTYPNSTLIIGNADSDMGAAGTERLFRTRMTNNTNFIQNDNAIANAGNGDGISAAGLNGIWVRTVGSVFTPVLGTYTMTNAGSVQNNSIIEVGVCM